MIRLILLVFLVVLVAVGGLAVLLFEFWGWKGLIAFPFLVLGLLWLGKLVVSKVIKRFALGLFSMKSRVLRGATIQVHSITLVPEPTETAVDDSTDEPEVEDEEENEPEQKQEEEKESPEPKAYYELDVTITPGPKGRDGLWEASELMLTSGPVNSLEELEEKEVGTTHEVLVWDGTKFGDDDPGKYPGEQRLKVTFAAKPGVSKVWLQYYNETIGELSLPIAEMTP
jgi:hypothetical protein